MEQAVPLWATYLLGSEDALRSFQTWIEERKDAYAKACLESSHTMKDVFGFRFAAGELDAQLWMVMAPMLEEEQRRSQSGE